MTACDVGTWGPGFGQNKNGTMLNRLTRSQPQNFDNLMSN
jgi:hypothetical protein